MYNPESQNENAPEQLRKQILSVMMNYGSFSNSTSDFKDELAKILHSHDESDIYRDLVKDMTINPENYSDYILALKHVLYYDLEQINARIFMEFRNATQLTKIPDLLHKKEIDEARGIIERFRSVIGKKDVKEIVDLFHDSYGDESDNDFLSELSGNNF